MKKIIYLFLITSFIFVSCHHITFKKKRTANHFPSQDEWYNNFIVGLAETEGPIDVDAVCPEGFSRVESYQSFLNSLVLGLTMAIYTPLTIKVYCANTDRSYLIELDENRNIVAFGEAN